MWCMRRTNIYLEDGQTAMLDRLAAEEGVSRAEIIRRLLDRALMHDDGDLAGDLDAIERSFGVLEDVDVLSRTGGARGEHLAALWQSAT